jgi:hypothetical protein
MMLNLHNVCSIYFMTPMIHIYDLIRLYPHSLSHQSKLVEKHGSTQKHISIDYAKALFTPLLCDRAASDKTPST